MDLSWFVSVPGIFLLFPLIWIGVCLLLSRLSGWSRLAQQFGVAELPKGHHFKMVSGFVGKQRFAVRYRGVLSMLLNDDGVGFSLARPFRFGAPPIFIPWEQIEWVQPGRALLSKGTLMHIRGHWSVINVLGDPGHVINDWVENNPDRVQIRPGSNA